MDVMKHKQYAHGSTERDRGKERQRERETERERERENEIYRDCSIP